MTGEGPGGATAPEGEGVSRRRFVQVCVAAATVAAAGSALAAIVGRPSGPAVPAAPRARTSVAVCPVCSVGCGLEAVSSGGEPSPSGGDPLSTSTGGMVCARGTYTPGRDWPATLTGPMARVAGTAKGSPAQPSHFEPIAWDDALDLLASKLIEVEADIGPDGRGCLMDGGVPLEDCYMAAKLWKGAMRSGAIDCVESLHSRAAEAAMLEQLGASAPPTCLADIGLASLIVVVGEDLAVTHPVLYARVAEAVLTRGARLVVVDPRATATAARAGALHVPCKAGAEVALLNAVGYVLVHELGKSADAWAAEHAINAASFREFLKLYNPRYDPTEAVDPALLVSLCDGDAGWVQGLGNRDDKNNIKSFDVPTITGLTDAQVRELATLWASASGVVTILSSRLGGAADGGAAASSVLNLHLLTAQLGRAGAGPFFLTATAAGRGAYDAGATPMGLPGGTAPVVGAPPAPLLAAWGSTLSDSATRARTMGAMDILAAAAEGRLPRLLLLGGTVTASLPDQAGLLEQAMASAYVAATVAHLEDPDADWADLLLPRLPWPQRECHYISADRRVARSLPCMGASAGPRTELEVLAALGALMTSGGEFEARTSAAAMAELSRATEGAAADMSALPVGDALTEARGVQWPVATATQAALKGTARRHMGQDGRGTGFPTPTGKALVVPREHRALADAPTMDRAHVAVLSVDDGTWWDSTQYLPEGGAVVRDRERGESYVELASEDALAIGALGGESVIVSTERGQVLLPVRIAPAGTARGHVFLPWGSRSHLGTLPPSGKRDRNGTPPWSTFAVRVERAV